MPSKFDWSSLDEKFQPKQKSGVSKFDWSSLDSKFKPIGSGLTDFVSSVKDKLTPKEPLKHLYNPYNRSDIYGQPDMTPPPDEPQLTATVDEPKITMHPPAGVTTTPSDQFLKDIDTQRNLRNLKKNADSSTGSFQATDAMAKGFTGIKPKTMDPDAERAFPVASAVGKLAGYAATGYATKGIGPTVAASKIFDKVPKSVNLLARFTGARAAHGAVQFGLKDASDNIAALVQGDTTPGKALADTAHGVASGAVLGASGAIPKAMFRIPAETAYGYADAKLRGASDFDSALNAATFGILGALNQSNITKEDMIMGISGFGQAVHERAMEHGYDNVQAGQVLDEALAKIQREAGRADVTVRDYKVMADAIKNGDKIVFSKTGIEGPSDIPPSARPGIRIEGPSENIPPTQAMDHLNELSEGIKNDPNMTESKKAQVLDIINKNIGLINEHLNDPQNTPSELIQIINSIESKNRDTIDPITKDIVKPAEPISVDEVVTLEKAKQDLATGNHKPDNQDVVASAMDSAGTAVTDAIKEHSNNVIQEQKLLQRKLRSSKGPVKAPNTFIGQIRKRGGVTMKSVLAAGYTAQDVRESGLLSIINNERGGRLDELANAMYSEGEYLWDGKGNLTDSFFQYAKAKGKSIHYEASKQYEDDYDRKLQEYADRYPEDAGFKNELGDTQGENYRIAKAQAESEILQETGSEDAYIDPEEINKILNEIEQEEKGKTFQSLIPGTEAKFPTKGINPTDKNLMQEKGELFQTLKHKSLVNEFGDEKPIYTEARKYASAKEFIASKPYISKKERRELYRQFKKDNKIEFVSQDIDRGDSIHSPSNAESGAPLYDLSDNGIYPEDVYSFNGLKYYGTGEDAMDRQAYSIISNAEGRPSAPIKIYRAVEKDGKAIMPGDWVTTVKAYAKEHGDAHISGEYKIVSKTVSARDIFTNGDSWLEYGYHPQKYVSGFKPLTMIWEKANFSNKIKQTDTPEFKAWFGDSKVVDEQGKPLAIYSGHSNVSMYGSKYQPNKGTAGGYYASEDPDIASNYSLGKFGSKEFYENGDQYRLAGKNGELNKKIWQVELTDAQKRKLDELSKEENEYGDSIYGLSDMKKWAKDNERFDPIARRLNYNPYSLQNIYLYMEQMGLNIAYPDSPESGDAYKPLVMRQNTNRFEDMLNALGIEWNSYEWQQPGVQKIYLKISNPLDASKPFPSDLLQAVKQAAKYERNSSSIHNDKQWTKNFPLKEWIAQIESGSEFWTTHIPKKALPIIKSFGYDGIKELGLKGSDKPVSQRQVNWIAFDPTQIKSATGNKGTFDKNNPNMLYQQQSNLGFYSHLEKTIQDKMPNSATPEQIRGILNNSGVKQEEIDWLDIEGFLKDKPKVSKQELLDYIRSNDVKVEETIKGDIKVFAQNKLEAYAEKHGIDKSRLKIDADSSGLVYIAEYSPQGNFNGYVDGPWRGASGDTKFYKYQLPGGENYKELLLTLPTKESLKIPDGWTIRQESVGNEDAFRVYNEKGQITRFRGRTREAAEKNLLGLKNDSIFKSSHFDEPNVLAHVRFNERTDSEGKRVLFIEEVQSDWAQKGKKEGYQTGKAPEGISVREDENVWVVKFPDGKAIDVLKKEFSNAGEATKEAIRIRNNDPEYGFRVTDSRLPNQPFKKTESWAGLAMKRMLRYAAENGFDKIAWTTGEQQAERYDLSKQVDSVRYGDGLLVGKKGDETVVSKDNVSEKELENYIGKEPAKKLLEKTANEKGWKEISGLELKVGGEGMKGFYDQILPSFMNKYTKKWGGRVSSTELKIKDSSVGAPNSEARKNTSAFANVHSLELTPSIKESVLGGQPLFKSSEYHGKPSTVEIEIQKINAVMGRNGARDFVIKVVDKIEGDKGGLASGAYNTLTGSMRLARDFQIETTGYHESGHKLLREFTLSNPKYKSLVNDVFQERMKSTGKSEAATEEDLMDDFADAANKWDTLTGKVKALFEKLWRFLKSLFNKLSAKDKENILFRQWYEGKTKQKNSIVHKGEYKFQELSKKFGEGETKPLSPKIKELLESLKKIEPKDSGKKVADLKAEINAIIKSDKNINAKGLFKVNKIVEQYSSHSIAKQIVDEARAKGLLYTTESGKQRSKLQGLLKTYEESTGGELREYISNLLGKPGNPHPAVFKITGDIKKDSAIMKLIKEQSSQWKDINDYEKSHLENIRILEKVSGKDSWNDNILVDNIFGVIEMADGAYYDRLELETTDLKKHIEKIKPYSKEDAKLMVDYEANAPMDQKQKRVLTYLRNQFDILYKQRNEIREKLGKAPVKFRKNYLTHIIHENILQHLSSFFDGDESKMDSITNAQLDAIRKGDFTKGNMDFNKFAKPRMGKMTKLGAIGNYNVYLKSVLKEMYYAPALTHARKFTEYALLKQPKAYQAMTRLINELAGKNSVLDELYPAKVFGHPSVMKVRSLMYKAALLANLNFNAMNASNFSLAYPEIGNYVNIGAGKFLSDKSMKSKAFKNSVILKGRTVDIDFDLSDAPTIEKILNKLNSILEINNVGSVWVGAYLKGIRVDGMSEKMALRYADAIARRTQAGYKKYEISAWMRSNAGKTLSMFQTWTFNASHIVAYDLKGASAVKNTLRLPISKVFGVPLKSEKEKTRYGALLTLIGIAILFNSIYKQLGLRQPYAPDSFIPNLPNTPKFGNNRRQNPLFDLAGNVWTATTGKKPETRNRAVKKAILSVIPAGGQIGKIMDGRLFNEPQEEDDTQFHLPIIDQKDYSKKKGNASDNKGE